MIDIKNGEFPRSMPGKDKLILKQIKHLHMDLEILIKIRREKSHL